MSGIPLVIIDSDSDDDQNQHTDTSNSAPSSIRSISVDQTLARREEESDDEIQIVIPQRDEDYYNSECNKDGSFKRIYRCKPGEGHPFFIPDLCDGEENYPLRVINTLDDQDYGSGIFVYSKMNVYHGYRGPNFTNFCDCDGECRPKSCKCRMSSNIKLTDGKIDHLNQRKKIDYFNHQLVECGKNCACNGKCGNTYSTVEMPFRFEIFRRKHAGFGCRTLDRIKSGSFVSEFIGEVISKTQALERKEQSFMYTSYYCGRDDQNCDYVIDPFVHGNVSRFFNHSCNENLSPFRFFKDHRWECRPHLGFFAKRDISAGEELTIDYGQEWWTTNTGKAKNTFNCSCDSDYCVIPGPKRYQIADEEITEEIDSLERELKQLEEEHVKLKKMEQEQKKDQHQKKQQESLRRAVKRSKRLVEKSAKRLMRSPSVK